MFRKKYKVALISGLLWLCICTSVFALEPWQAALARMPLRTYVAELTKTNCIPLMLASFQENDVAKALIFMPGATDEFYFFNRGYAKLDSSSPTLLDAVAALTNQTLVHATFRAPFILIHSAEDPLEPLYKLEDVKTTERIRDRKFVKHALYDDRDWDFLLPILTFQLDTKFLPVANAHASNHFYRHSLAAWNLTGWEALEAISMAGKTTFTVQKRKVVFEGDTRFRARPPVPTLP